MRFNPAYLMSDDELIEMLMSRYDHAIFAGRKIDPSPEDETEQVEEYQGDHTMCKGLAADLVEKITKEVYEMQCEEEEDD